MLASLLASVTTSFSDYLTASKQLEKAAALERLAQTAQALSRAATDPLQTIEEFTNQPLSHACARIATDMGVFGALTGESATLQQIASATGAEYDFTLRIMRALASVGLFHQVDEETYAHTPVSRMWTNPAAQASLTYWEDTARTLLQFTPYFAKYGFKSPSDPMNTPVAFARGEQDTDVFTLMSRDLASLETFQKVMSIASKMSAKELCDTFRFDTLKTGDGDDGVVLVDVGGGKGQTLYEILEAFPQMQGRVVLEDLQVVLDTGTLVSEKGDRVKLQPYDFFKDVQPVKGSLAPHAVQLVKIDCFETGAAAYLYKWVFHDWPDDYCLTILANLAPAMRGHASSKLLVCDLVLPDKNPSSLKALRDINMMQCSGKERSVKQWHTLLNKAGFRIVEIHGLGNQMNSVIEAVLDEQMVAEPITNGSGSGQSP